jgi:DNA gyrase subunit A
MERPNLTGLQPSIIQYIEYLENELAVLRVKSTSRISAATVDRTDFPVSEAKLLPEPPTNVSIITVSQTGLAKRTFRHVYMPQHRSGMGVFDLDVDLSDHLNTLGCAQIDKNLLLFTNRARVFRVPVNKILEGDVRSKGQPILDRIVLEEDEQIAFLLPERAQGYVAMVSKIGKVRILRHHMFGEHMRPGTEMYNYREFGSLAAGCWTTGDMDLFILSRKGLAIRFGEKLISPKGDQGIRLAPDDEVVGITGVQDSSKVFLVSADGKGTCRLMSGFAPNKSTGGSGKLAMKNDHMVGAQTIESGDHLFIISRLGKIIRFDGDEVPVTEGVVQGVNCMNLRADEAITVIKSGPNYP